MRLFGAGEEDNLPGARGSVTADGMECDMERSVFCDPKFRSIPCVIAIGVFDGFHLGHQGIVGETVALARETGARSVVVSFSVNPKTACGSMPPVPALQSARSFEEMLANRGVNHHCVIDFSSYMSKLSCEEFIALLCTSYDVRAMVVGNSFRAGRPPLDEGPDGISRLLCKYTSSAYLKVVPSVSVNGEEASSSLIRRCLLTGDLDRTSGLLGRAYSLDLRDSPSGPVFGDAGRKRLFYDVRTLGLFLPKAGKYVVEATEGSLAVKAVASVSEDRLALELPVRMIPDGITFLGE